VASVFQENYYSKLFPEINFPKVGAENDKKKIQLKQLYLLQFLPKIILKKGC
jgi:hypothetical protein